MMTLEEFLATRRKMSIAGYNEEYGLSEADFDSDVDHLLVYTDHGLYLEVLPDGTPRLFIGRSYFYAEQHLLEQQLYDYASIEGFLT